MGFRLLSSQDIHLAPLHKDLSDKDVLPSVLWIDGSHGHLRSYRNPDSIFTLPPTPTFLGSRNGWYLRVSSSCFLKLRRLELDH